MSNSSSTIAQLSSTTKGTAQFWAPELLEEDFHSAESDVWAFGMTIYVHSNDNSWYVSILMRYFQELVQKEHPYKNAPIVRVVVMIMREQLPEWPFSQVTPTSSTAMDEELYDYLRNVSMQCWKLDPKERPQIKSVQMILSEKLEWRNRMVGKRTMSRNCD